MLRRRLCGLFGPRAVLVVLCLLSPAPLAAQGVDYIKAHYTKQEHTHPDARRREALHVGLRPQGRSRRSTRSCCSGRPTGSGRTARTPIGATWARRPAFAKDGYIVAYQDVRGLGQSEGEFVNMRPHSRQKEKPTDIDESTDTYDTIDWLVKNVPDNNGRVGMWGISYPGLLRRLPG